MRRWFKRKPKTIGLALGGGGARGLAHVHVLEVLDELNIRPYRIAGTSIGAVIGAFYASGKTGAEIREIIQQWAVPHPGKHKYLKRYDLYHWAAKLDPAFSRGGLFRGDKIMYFISDSISCETFEELQIPLYLTATDYADGSQVVMSSGDLFSALRASMAIPCVFTPEERGGRILIDGGVVNPLPYDLLQDECDIVIAVDAGGVRDVDENHRPGFWDTAISSFEIMQDALVQTRLHCNPPDIYLHLDVRNTGLLEFYKAMEIYHGAAGVRERFRVKLKTLLSAG